jgi:transcriptional regulator with XRE-family HTH domain
MLHGERLRMQRTQLSLSQSALGKLIHKDGQYVSKLERGVLSSVTTDTLEQLALALKVSTDYLLNLTDDPRPRPRRTRQRDDVDEDEAA